MTLRFVPVHPNTLAFGTNVKRTAIGVRVRGGEYQGLLSYQKNEDGSFEFFADGETILLGGAGGSGITSEQAVDAVAAALAAGNHTNVTVVYDDNGNRINLAAAGGAGGGVTAEEVQDLMNTALVHAGHTNVTVTYDDANNRFVFVGAAAGGGGSATAEEVQDLMNTALAHANHVGMTVTYDDANNRFVFTNTGGAGGASVLSRKLTLVVNGQTVTAVVKGSGSSTDLAAITAASSLDGSSSLVVTLSNLGSFKLDSVAVNVPASANAGTSFTLTAPDPTGATALADSGLASLAIYNDAGVVQAATSVTMAMSGSNLVVTKSGLVANTAYRFKVVY